MTAYSEAARDQAVAWFNRLQDPRMEESAWAEFTGWLEAAPEHRAAYDAVEAVWLGFEPLPQAQVLPFPGRKPKPAFRLRFAAAAALAVALVGAGAFAYVRGLPGPAQSYATGPGEVKTLTLADGSKVTLDRGTRLRVVFGKRQRTVELVSGEANFEVAHNPSRPFVVLAGDRRVEDIGTEFDVLNQAGRLQITVAEGEVAVGPSHGQAVDHRLHPGERLEARAGRPTVISKVDAEDAAGWMNGVLVYRGAPLEDVAADLGRYLGAPVRLGPGAETMRFSGVLRIADGTMMLERLEAFLPLRVSREPQGVVLNPRAS
jgi:transmembrane sensor